MIPLLLATALAAGPDLARPVNLEVKDVAVEKFFGALEVPVHFDVPVHGNISVTLKNAPLSSALDIVTAKLGMSYRVDGKSIVIAPVVAAAPPAVSPSLPAQCPDRSAEIGALRKRVTELEDTILSMRQQQTTQEGSPVEWPVGLEPRLRDAQQLRNAFINSFKVTGFPKGEVTNVDCSEYPCIVFGKGFGNKGDLERLKQASAFEAYAKDSTSVFGWAVSKDPEDSNEYIFAVAFLQSDAPKSDAARSRLRIRVEKARSHIE